MKLKNVPRRNQESLDISFRSRFITYFLFHLFFYKVNYNLSVTKETVKQRKNFITNYQEAYSQKFEDERKHG